MCAVALRRLRHIVHGIIRRRGRMTHHILLATIRGGALSCVRIACVCHAWLQCAAVWRRSGIGRSAERMTAATAIHLTTAAKLLASRMHTVRVCMWLYACVCVGIRIDRCLGRMRVWRRLSRAHCGCAHHGQRQAGVKSVVTHCGQCRHAHG